LSRCLPAGTSLNTSTGTVSGTPTTLATYSGVTIRVVDSNPLGAVTVDLTGLSFVVSAQLAITGTPSATGTAGAPYSFTPGTTGGQGTNTFALTGTLPAGLTFSVIDGSITGTPTTVQTASGLSITATDADGRTATLTTFSIAVSASGGALAFSVAPTITGGVGGAIYGGNTLWCGNGTVTGGTPPYVYTKQWKRSGSSITGAIYSGWTTLPADVGIALQCVVLVTDALGATATSTVTAASAVLIPGLTKTNVTGAGAPAADFHIHAHSDTASVDGNGRVTSITNQGAASVTVAGGSTDGALGGPFKQLDAYGQYEYDFRGSEYLDVQGAFTSNSRAGAFVAVMHCRETGGRIISVGSKAGGTAVNGSSVMSTGKRTNFPLMVQTGGNLSSETNTNWNKFWLGSNKVAIGVRCGSGASAVPAGANTHFVNGNNCNIPRTSTALSALGFEVGRNSFTPGTVGTYTRMKIKELIGWITAPTVAQIQAVVDAMVLKHGIETIVGIHMSDGDSKTAQTGHSMDGNTPMSWLFSQPDQGCLLRQDYVHSNNAVGGDAWAQIQSRLDTTYTNVGGFVASVYQQPIGGTSNQLRNVLSINGGANDWNGHDARPLKLAYLTDAIGKGWKCHVVVPQSIGPRNDIHKGNWIDDKAYTRGALLADLSATSGGANEGKVLINDVAAWPGINGADGVGHWFENYMTFVGEQPWYVDEVHEGQTIGTPATDGIGRLAIAYSDSANGLKAILLAAA
jgi:hypothetical protein